MKNNQQNSNNAVRPITIPCNPDFSFVKKNLSQKSIDCNIQTKFYGGGC